MPRSTTAFSVGPRVIGIGQEVDDDDPILEGRGHLFGLGDVEQATAAPGEKSTARRVEPSRSGKTDDWVKFASVVTGTDESEWADVGRNDIIAKLEADGHIDPAEQS